MAVSKETVKTIKLEESKEPDETINQRFLSRFHNDTDGLIEWLMSVGLISDHYDCPCGKEMRLIRVTRISDGRLWVCPSKCIRRTIRKGSWFGKSRLSLFTTLMVTYRWCMGDTMDAVRYDWGVQSHTLGEWYNFCREVCTNDLMLNPDHFGGPDVIVEIGTHFFGSANGTRARKIVGQLVFGGVERGTRKCFLEIINDTSVETIKHLIKRHVLPGSIITSDARLDVGDLTDLGYKHLTVDRRKHFIDQETGAHTQSIESTWSVIKRRIPRSCHNERIEGYFSEYIWRRKHSHKKDLIVPAFFAAIRQLYPPKSQDDPKID